MIGSEVNPTYTVYGDESRSDEVVTYGLVIIRDADVRAAEQNLKEIKTRFGSNPDEPLHCRKLFAGDRRRKTSFKHLTKNDLIELYAQSIIGVMACRTRFAVGHIRKGAAPSVMIVPWAIPGRPTSGPQKMTDKHLTVFAAHCATVPLRDEIGGGNYRLVVDPDSTLIEWFGVRRQARNLLQGEIDGRPLPVPEPTIGEKPSLLQMADLIAYAAAKAFTERPVANKRECTDLFKLMAPRETSMTFHKQVFADQAETIRAGIFE